MKKILYISILSLLVLNVSFNIFSLDQNMQPDSNKKKLPSASIIDSRVDSDEILEKMKTNILNQLNNKLENDPDNVWAIIMKGWTMNSLGKFDKAIDFFNEALKIQKAPSAYMGLGMAYIRKGELEKANSCYMKALEQKEASNPYYYGDTKLPDASLTVKDKDIGTAPSQTN